MNKLDARHSVAKEYWTGHDRPLWVHRFLGEWIAGYATKAAAELAARQWEAARQARMIAEAEAGIYAR